MILENEADLNDSDEFYVSSKVNKKGFHINFFKESDFDVITRTRESISSDDILSNDLEKTNAVVAAFTVVIIFATFFIEIATTAIFMIIITSGDPQSIKIAKSNVKRKIAMK